MNLRSFAAFPAIAAAATLLAGCAPRSFPEPPIAVLPRGGVDISVGPIRLDDIWLDAPSGVATGAAAPLRIALTNDSTAPDALTHVSTPVAARVALERDGHAVERIDIPAWAHTNLEHGTGVLVEGIRLPLRPGEWSPVTFTFARAGSITVPVTVGPLGVALACKTATGSR